MRCGVMQKCINPVSDAGRSHVKLLFFLSCVQGVREVQNKTSVGEQCGVTKGRGNKECILRLFISQARIMQRGPVFCNSSYYRILTSTVCGLTACYMKKNLAGLYPFFLDGSS